MIANANVTAVDLDLHFGVFIPFVGRAAQGRGQQQEAEGFSVQGKHPETGPCQQAAQLVGAAVLADRVEAPVQDALAGLQSGQQPSQAVGGVAGLLRQVIWLRCRQIAPQPLQHRRVLAHQQLHREIQGVQRTGEGPQLGLV